MKTKKQIIVEVVDKFLNEDVDNSPILDNAEDYIWFYLGTSQNRNDDFLDSSLYNISKQWYPNGGTRKAYGIPIKYKNKLAQYRFVPLDLSTLK